MLPLRDTIRSRHFPLVNWLILGANTVVFLYTASLSAGEENQFLLSYALIPARTFSLDPKIMLTLFSSMFMHASWFHFLSNMWILYIFGDNVEDRMGPFGYLGFYLLSGLAAAVLQVAFYAGSTVPTLGASGAIAGVLGAYMLMYPTATVDTLVFLFVFATRIRLPAVIFLGFWFISQLYSGIASIGSGLVGGVAWWAHIGGFVFGLTLSPFFRFRPPPPPEQHRIYFPPPPEF